ncbi:hypothetical protein ACWD6P_26425 [Streptomyces sp. NPDC002446]
MITTPRRALPDEQRLKPVRVNGVTSPQWLIAEWPEVIVSVLVLVDKAAAWPGTVPHAAHSALEEPFAPLE